MFWKTKRTLVVTVWLSTTSAEEINQASNMVQTDMEQIAMCVFCGSNDKKQKTRGDRKHCVDRTRWFRISFLKQ